MKIYKYEIKPVGDTRLEVPHGARFLHLDMQKGKPHVWLAVRPTSPLAPLTIRAVPTGGEVTPDFGHLKTLLFNGGDLVVHYFEVPS